MHELIIIVISFVTVLSFSVSGQPRWEHTNISFPTVITDLGVIEKGVYAFCKEGTFFSSDTGATWIYVKDLGGCRSITESDSTVILMNSTGSVFVTNDHLNWPDGYTGFSFKRGSNIIANDGYVLVNDSDGVYRSNTSGRSWTSVSRNGLTDSCVVALALYRDTLIAATKDSGVFILRNSSKPWSSASSGLSLDNTGKVVTVYGLESVCGINVYGISDSGIYKSEIRDSLYSWSKVPGVPRGKIESLKGYITNDSSEFLYAVVDSIIYRSEDNDTNWVPVDSGFLADSTGVAKVTALAADGAVLYAGTAQGVYISTDNGESWRAADGHCNVNSLSAGKTALFASTSAGIYYSFNSGDEWKFTEVGEMDGAGKLASKGDTIFTTTKGPQDYDLTIAVSPDFGKNWWYSSIFVSGGSRGLAVLDNCIYMAEGHYSGLRRSCTDGRSWEAMRDALRLPENSTANIQSKCIKALNNTLFISFQRPEDDAGWVNHVYSSSDGEYWTQSDQGLLSAANSFAEDNGVFYAGTRDSGVFISTDNGNNWKRTNKGFDACISDLLSTRGFVMAGTDDGAYISGDRGETWIEIKEGLKNGRIRSLSANQDYVFAGTEGAGVYRVPIQELLTLHVEKKPVFSEHDPAPALCTVPGLLRVQFNIHTQDHLRVDLYNMSGKCIATIANRSFSEGKHILKWHTATLANGCYFVKIKSESHKYLNSLTFIKQ